jgi:hypothetical protein
VGYQEKVWDLGFACETVCTKHRSDHRSSRVRIKPPLAQICLWFLGAFAKLRRATISFIMSVCPHGSYNSAPTGRIFMKFYIWVIFENLSKKLEFHLNGTRTTDTLHEDQYIFLSHLIQFFLEWDRFRTNFVEKTKTHILCSTTFFLIIVLFMR